MKNIPTIPKCQFGIAVTIANPAESLEMENFPNRIICTIESHPKIDRNGQLFRLNYPRSFLTGPTHCHFNDKQQKEEETPNRLPSGHFTWKC